MLPDPLAEYIGDLQDPDTFPVDKQRWQECLQRYLKMARGFVMPAHSVIDGISDQI
jgi:hypothetical protein